jgi:hypothetical protein
MYTNNITKPPETGRLFYVFIGRFEDMKNLISILVLLVLSSGADARTIFFRAGAGYAYPLSNTQPLYLSGFPYTGGNVNPATVGAFKVEKASMLSGFRVSAGAGMMFSKIGFELAATTLPGTLSYNYSASIGDIYPPGSNTNITLSSGNTTVVIPSLVMNVPGKKIDVLLRAGLVFPAFKKLFVESQTENGSDKYYDKSELSTHFGIGFAFSGGIEYKIIKGLKAYATIDIITMSLRVKESNLVQSTNNGNDVLNQKFTYEKKTIYVEDVSNYTFSSDEPFVQPVYSLPFGAKGISAGLSYSL